MPPGDSYRGSYRGDPRGRERAIANRQTARADIQSQVDSFSQMPIYDRGSSQDRMRSRTFSAPAPIARTPVQKTYNEIRTRTPTVVKRTTTTPREVVRDVDQDSGGSVARNIQAGAGASLVAAGGEQVRQRSSDIKQIKGFLEKNKGSPLTEAQKKAVKYGSKISNKLFEKAYGEPGSWTKYLTARTTPGHFGPVEWGMKTASKVGRMLGPVGLLNETMKLGYSGTKGILDITGGTKFLEGVGSKIAQETGATQNPWGDFLAWLEGQGG